MWKVPSKEGICFMVVKVFILGRPGSGKSTAIDWIIELAGRRGYSATHIRDYDILLDMFKRDTKGERFLPDDHGGFIVTKFPVLNTALKQLETQVEKQIQELHRLSQEPQHLSTTQKEILLIEFARDNYDAALKNFTPEFLEGAYFLFLDLNLEKCIERIRLRRDNRSPVHIRRDSDASKLDRHFVSDSIMEKYYRTNNWSKTQGLSDQDPITQNVKVLDNSRDWGTFILNVSDFAETIFRKEFCENHPPESQPSVQPALEDAMAAV